MNIALIIAGGSGQRMQSEIPKQFINVYDKPVLIYTLEAFQKHPEIDAIGLVCIDGWHETVWAYARQYHITKLKHIVSGGKTGQESICNGIMELAKHYGETDLISIHDAIRPMVSAHIISENLAVCRQYGGAITAISCAEAMFFTEDKSASTQAVDRDKLMRTQTPQCYPLGKLVWAHQEAKKRGIPNSVATCTLMCELGETIHFSAGSERNVKLTTQDDLDIFRALLTNDRRMGQ